MPDRILGRITWRWWAALTATIGTYVGLGFWLGHNGTVQELMIKWGLLGASIAPLLLIAVYTWSGNKWWGNDVGSAIVQIKLCVMWLVVPLTWVFWVDGGMLHPGWLAWAEVSAPGAVTLALLRLCWVFVRVHLKYRKENQKEIIPASLPEESS
jgi:hypothetical protein